MVAVAVGAVCVRHVLPARPSTFPRRRATSSREGRRAQVPRRNRAVTSHAVVACVLKRLVRAFDLQIREVVPDLVGQVDDADVLPMQVVHAGGVVEHHFFDPSRDILDVEQRAKLVAAENVDLPHAMCPHGQEVHNEIHPDP